MASLRKINLNFDPTRIGPHEPRVPRCVFSPSHRPFLQHHKYFSSGRLTESGPALLLADIGRADEGTYVCVADNKVSRPVNAKITLNVLCE